MKLTMSKIKEFRVYVLSADYDFDTCALDIENWQYYEQRHGYLPSQAEIYIDICEKEGSVYSLEDFVNAMNFQENDLSNSLIYITNNY